MMYDMLSVSDLFTVGLGIDVAGAYLLARGLLASPAVMARRRKRWSDFNPSLAVAQAEDKVDAMFGLSALGIGFFIQTVGYVLTLAGIGGATGGSAALFGIALAVIAAALILVGHRYARTRGVKTQLIRIAMFSSARSGDEERLEKPSAQQLYYYGVEMGVDPLPDESAAREAEGYVAYARRVFGVQAEHVPGEPLYL